MRVCFGCWVLAFCLVSAGFAESPSSQPSTKKTSGDKKAEEQKNPKATDWYESLLAAYRKAQWEEFKDLYKQWETIRLKLTPSQRDDVLYMRKTAAEFRPGWWKNTRSSKNRSFTARIWNRPFVANYVPSETLGEQAAVGIRHHKLLVVVSWRPSYIDNDKPFTNENSFGIYLHDPEKYDFRMGDMGEVIVWHELGHNYISTHLPLKQVITLYNEYGMLFSHLQEFYADLTAMYHSSLPGRLFTMKFRLLSLICYDESNAHARGCGYGVGALILSKVLSEPEKWPSFHFPGKVPEEEAERYTIAYLYKHVDPNWTLQEDRQLREFIGLWVRRAGESALRKKGKVILPNQQTFMLLAMDDRPYEAKRNRWVKEKLEKIIQSGRADDPKIFEKDLEEFKEQLIHIHIRRSGSTRTTKEKDEKNEEADKKKDAKPESKKEDSDKSEHKDKKEKGDDENPDLDELLGGDEDSSDKE